MALRFSCAFLVGGALHSFLASASASADSPNKPYIAPYSTNPANSRVYFDVAEQGGRSFFGMTSQDPIGRI